MDFTSSLRNSRPSSSSHNNNTPRHLVSSSRSSSFSSIASVSSGSNANLANTNSSSNNNSTRNASMTAFSPHAAVRRTNSREAIQPNSPMNNMNNLSLQRTAISNSFNARGSNTEDDASSVGTAPSTTFSPMSSPMSAGSYRYACSIAGSGLTVGSSSSSISGSEGRGSNFKVVIRVRPPLPRELHGDRPFQNVIDVDTSGHVLTVSENLSALSGDESGNGSGGNGVGGAYGSHVFSFDHVYDQHCTQRSVYENTAKAVVESSLEGYNATIFAYGQTGTGKTYTMEGFNSAGSVEERGIIPRAIEQIFMHIQSNVSARMRFLVRASYLQIYNESISDLLKPERNNLTIREDKKRGVFVEGLSEWVVRSPEEIYGLMERGGAMRATGSTKMNEISSRSHAVFIIIAEQSHTTYVDENGNEITVEEFHQLMNQQRGANGADPTGTSGGVAGGPGAGSIDKHRFHRNNNANANNTNVNNNGPNGTGNGKLDSFVRQSFKVGKLNLVDLAGSERVRLSGATGQRLEESKKINQSLSALGNVIAALTDARGRQHIPYRDSKLTRILEDSLGGNCKTTMMAMISPALEAMVESLSTLKFANRAKNIKNEARVNEDLDQKSLLRKYERELKRLRAELEEKNRNVVDKRRLLELDEQRRRAEEDKMAAIRALEERSREFMKEKEEKKKLEQRICMLTSQMLMSNKLNKASSSVVALSSRNGFGSTTTTRNAVNGGPDQLLAQSGQDHHSDSDLANNNGDGNSGSGAMISWNENDENGGANPTFFNGANGMMMVDAQDPLVREVIREHQERIRKEYECRLADLEKERETIEEEKAQVDRYKQLLLKQRDIMIALTQRLNERDEQITALQDELDAYDRHQKELEEKLDEKTAHLIHLQRVTMEHNASSPSKNAELIKALGEWACKEQTFGSSGCNATSGGNGTNSGGGPNGAVGGNSVAPELLITFKQFRPHPANQVVFANGNATHLSDNSVASASASSSATTQASTGVGSASAAPTAVPSLLSAEEKLQELTRLLDTQQHDSARLAKELEEVRAEKVSIEFLLREKMDKLVQSEIESKMKLFKQQQQQEMLKMDQLQKQLALLQSENQQLQRQHSGARASSSANPSEEVLQARCETLTKERKALQTIMEMKIKALVTAISEASDATLQSAGGMERVGEPAKWLAREINALQRLVNASIVALRNADQAQQQQQQQQQPKSSNKTQSPPRAQHPQSVTFKTLPSSTSNSGSSGTSVFGSKSNELRRSDKPSNSAISSSSTTVSSPSLSVPQMLIGGSVSLSGSSNNSSISSMSVEQLIQQRRAQLQKERRQL